MLRRVLDMNLRRAKAGHVGLGQARRTEASATASGTSFGSTLGQPPCAASVLDPAFAGAWTDPLAHLSPGAMRAAAAGASGGTGGRRGYRAPAAARVFSTQSTARAATTAKAKAKATDKADHAVAAGDAASDVGPVYGGGGSAADAAEAGAGPAPKARKPVTVTRLRAMRKKGEPITMITAYDTPTARLADEAGVDMILVGDSVGMVCLGLDDTVSVTMADILHHSRAVTRGASKALVVGDMPFGSYTTPAAAVDNAIRFLKEGRVAAVKLEGGAAVAPHVRAMTDAGIAVVGHIGLTPQSVSALGGFTLQGKSAAAALKLLEDARALQEAGAIAIVLELVPSELAAAITEALDVPTIGIGAGGGTSGQVLVMHDMLGLFGGAGLVRKAPRFVKQYAALGDAAVAAIADYVGEVKGASFPTPAHAFDMAPQALAEFREAAGLPPMPTIPEADEEEDHGAEATATRGGDEAPAATTRPLVFAGASSALARGDPVRVAVIGGGAMGSLFAAHLSRAGHDVAMVTQWREHAAEVRRSGVIVTNGMGGPLNDLDVTAAAADAAAAELRAGQPGYTGFVAHDVAVVTPDDLRARLPAWLAARGAGADGAAHGHLEHGSDGAEEASLGSPWGPGAADVVLVLVKGHRTAEAAAVAAAAAHPDTGVVLTLQNGATHLGILQHAVGADRVIYGVTAQGAHMLGPGRVAHGGMGPTTLVPPLPEEDHPLLADAADTVAAMLQAAGLPAAARPSRELDAVLVEKLTINACINPLTAVMGERNGAILEHDWSRGLMARVHGEVLASARGLPQVTGTHETPAAAGTGKAKAMAKGADGGSKHASRASGAVALSAEAQLEDEARALVPSLARVEEVIRATRNNSSSMLADVRRGESTEVDFINGVIVAAGVAAGVETPANAGLVELVHSLRA